MNRFFLFLLGFMKFLGSVKEEMVRKTRYSTYAVVSIWKILFFFGSTLLILFKTKNFFKEKFLET